MAALVSRGSALFSRRSTAAAAGVAALRWKGSLSPSTVERLTGTPQKQLRRTVRIHKPMMHAMQSGTAMSDKYRLEFIEND